MSPLLTTVQTTQNEIKMSKKVRPIRGKIEGSIHLSSGENIVQNFKWRIKTNDFHKAMETIF